MRRQVRETASLGSLELGPRTPHNQMKADEHASIAIVRHVLTTQNPDDDKYTEMKKKEIIVYYFTISPPVEDFGHISTSQEAVPRPIPRMSRRAPEENFQESHQQHGSHGSVIAETSPKSGNAMHLPASPATPERIEAMQRTGYQIALTSS